MTPSERATSPSDQTRLALIHAALTLFARQGFDGTSTREIAALAKANIGSISYHFGGKDGLRMAVADHIVSTMQAIAGPALGSLDASLSAGMDSDSARRQLHLVLERMVGFLIARPEAGEIVQFVLRELSQPTPALDRIYSGVFEPVHRRLCLLWEAATGQAAESDAVRLTVFTLIGQLVYFRIGREAVLRRMGWPEIGPEQASAVLSVVSANLDAILDSRKGDRP